MVDLRGLFDRAATEGIPAGDRRITSAQGGGIFSCDGVHPTKTGQAIVANAFLDSIDLRFAAGIPRVDVAAVAASDPLVVRGLSACVS